MTSKTSECVIRKTEAHDDKQADRWTRRPRQLITHLSSMSSPTTSDDDDDGFYGPSLPPPESPTDRVIGPVLPPHLRQRASDEEEDEDVPTIGPLPPGSQSDPHPDVVVRKPKLQDDQQKREEWMTVIPEKVERKLGFKSVTSFSQRPVLSKSSDKDSTIKPSVGNIETEMQKEYEERKRSASLLDIHQKELKKQKDDKPAASTERQPFDPEKDLQVRKLDTRQTRSVINNSKLLNTRFSAGPSKFL